MLFPQTQIRKRVEKTRQIPNSSRPNPLPEPLLFSVIFHSAWCLVYLMHGQSGSLYEDAMIAATARVHGLTVVTRNERDFATLMVPLLNPFRFRK